MLFAVFFLILGIEELTIIENYINVLLYTKTSISACSLFEINYNFIFIIVGSLLSYSIIIYQITQTKLI